MPTVEQKVLVPDAERIGAAIGRIPSGCSILTAAHEGITTGVLVSWVQQASFSPPMVTVCLRQGRPIVDLVESSRRFLLNVLGDPSTDLFRHFGRGFPLHEDAFAGLTTEVTLYGPLLPSCIAHLGCEVASSLPTGDHLLIAARVVAGSSNGAVPYTHIRKTGMNY